MSDIAVKVEGLGKKYLIGHQKSDSIKDSLRQTVGHLFGNQRKEIEEFWALHDINFEIKKGEAVGIIGKNGAGKSTLLKVLSRITHPTTGRFEINGRVSSLLEVGTGFHPELSGRENTYLNGTILGMTRKEIKSKFDEIVEFSGVEKFLDTPVKHYSSGMYVRLAFAVAAHLEPEILIIDEVLAVGDSEFQKKCLGKMDEVAKQGRTVLFVSHNMAAVKSLCSKGIILENGSVTYKGLSEKAIYQYASKNAVPNIASGSLINHPNREKGLQPILTKFLIENESHIQYGQPLKMRIKYIAKKKITYPQFSIFFHTPDSVLAFILDNSRQGASLSYIEGKGEIECTIKSLPLLPGDYYISMKLWQPGEKLDDVENIKKIEVTWVDSQQLGQYNWDSNWGLVYVDANWNEIK